MTTKESNAALILTGMKQGVGQESNNPPSKINAQPRGKVWTTGREEIGIGEEGASPQEGWATNVELKINPGKRGNESGGRRRKKTKRRNLKKRKTRKQSTF